MDEAIELIRSKRNVSESSLKSYRQNLSKVLKVMDCEHFNCLDMPDDVNKALFECGASPSSIRSYLASICVLRTAQEKPVDEYRKFLLTLTQDQNKKNKEHVKTEKEEKNWTTMEALQKVVKKYENDLRKDGVFGKKDLNKKEYDLLQRYVVGTLYVGDPENHPPVRCDYAPMRIVSRKEYDLLGKERKENYLVVTNRNKKQFAFHNYKSVNTHGAKVFDVSKKVNKALNRLLKVHHGVYLLENKNTGVMTANNLSKYLTRVFAPTGKNISVNMLRHIFISENKTPEVINKYKNMSDKMLHTPATQDIYSKE
jgi:hypothetical protein